MSNTTQLVTHMCRLLSAQAYLALLQHVIVSVCKVSPHGSLYLCSLNTTERDSETTGQQVQLALCALETCMSYKVHVHVTLLMRICTHWILMGCTGRDASPSHVLQSKSCWRTTQATQILDVWTHRYSILCTSR